MQDQICPEAHIMLIPLLTLVGKVNSWCSGRALIPKAGLRFAQQAGTK